jgi:hypothetical protein
MPATVAEAVVGRFEFRDIKGSILILDGELLVPEDEVTEHERTFGIETPDLPVDEPFTGWTDLIEAVKKRTPEARKLIRYLEDFGYQDILKTRNEVMTTVGDKKVKQVRWENFLLPKALAQQQGYKDGADYNRHMFMELRKFAPRALAPEGFDPTKVKGGLFGGRKIMRGATGSKREMQKRRGPMVDKIIEENMAEIGDSLREIFDVLPEQWTDAFLGPNQQNVTIRKDTGSLQRPTIHLGGTIETIPSNKDFRELGRLKRVKDILVFKQKRSGDKATYQASIDEVTQKINDLEGTAQGKYQPIYLTIAVKMGPFYSALVRELKRVGMAEAGEDRYVSSTSLKNVPELLTLLDPPGSTGFSKLTGTRYGFREDFHDLVKWAINKALNVNVYKVDSIERDGDIFFDAYGDEGFERGPEDEYGVGLEKLATSEPESWIGKRAAELLEKHKETRAD